MAAKEQWAMYPVLFRSFFNLIFKFNCFYREFSKQPHIAGSLRQRELADELATNWTAFGFDKVEKPQYQVLLSFPQPNKPNRVAIVENSRVIYDITGKIKVCGLRFLAKRFSPSTLKAQSDRELKSDKFVSCENVNCYPWTLQPKLFE